MNGLVGIQWGEICVNLPIILGNMQAVGADIITVRKTKKVSEHQGEGGMQRPEAMVYSKLGHYCFLPQSLVIQLDLPNPTSFDKEKTHGTAKGEKNNVKGEHLYCSIFSTNIY